MNNKGISFVLSMYKKELIRLIDNLPFKSTISTTLSQSGAYAFIQFYLRYNMTYPSCRQISIFQLSSLTLADFGSV